MRLKMFDYVAPIVVLAVCAAAGKGVFLSPLAQFLEPEISLPFGFFQYVVYGAFPVALIGVFVVKAVTGQWLWNVKTRPKCQ